MTAEPPGSPGLARERTVVAWARTALGAAIIGTALLRVSVRSGAPTQFLSAIAAMVCAAHLAAASRATYRQSGREPRICALRLVTAEIVTLGVLTAINALL